jgi:transcriptional regulator with AAA-type ATPase domain
MEDLPGVVGSSAAMAALRAQVRRLLDLSSRGRLPAILLLGETGVGKGMLVRALHAVSVRRDQPLIDVNCAAIPESLVEAELFGFERGAFTDARQGKPGLFQAANQGVLFLDEIGTLPLGVQAKLLTALDQRQVRRLGGTRSEPVDVWIASATNEDLVAAVAQGRFRADLYHRISAVILRVPPLRERERDVLELAEHFLARACADYGLPPRRLTPGAQTALLAHAWPGNVRELANVMERVALLGEGTAVAAEALELPEPAPQRRQPRMAASSDPATSERDTLVTALEATQWNLSQAAARLGVPRNTLRYRIEKLGLRPAPPAASSAPASGPAASGHDVPAALRWERRSVSALRAELRGPADAGSREVARVLEALVAKVRGFGGQVDELHPLGFTAFFGLEPMEDAPARAVLAAHAMRRAADSAVAADGSTMLVSVGIDVDQCLIGRGAAVPGMDATDRQRVRATLDGLLGASAGGAIVVSPAAARLVQRAFDLDPMAAGYRVRARRPTSFAVGDDPGSPFVGRDIELAHLDELLVQAETGRGQVVALVGEAGVGKSRLLYEFVRGIGTGRVKYVEGRCTAYGATTPYQPIVDLVRQAFAVADEGADVAVRIRAGIGALGLDADALAPYVLHALGERSTGGAPVPALSPEAMRGRTVEALRQVTVAASQQRLLVIAVEDVQWIDPTSEEIVDAVAGSIAACRVLLIVTHRHGHRPRCVGQSYATSLVLRGLGRADSAVIVQAVAAALPAEVTDAIVSRADGIPFFLEELARATATPEDGRPAVVIPESIRSALTARLDRLPVPDRSVLEAAAVLGKEDAVALLREMAGRPEEEFRATMARLRSAELLHETSVVPTARYAFKHALIQEAAYASLTGSRRRALHAAAAAVIERLAPGIRERRPEVLGHHYSEAGSLPEAVEAWFQAGVYSLRRSANAEAIHHLERGLAVLRTLPAGPERARREIGLELALSMALAAQKGYGAREVEEALARVRALADEPGGGPERFTARFALWRFSLARADMAAVEAHAARLMAAATEQGDAQSLVAAHVVTGVGAFYLGQLGRARDHLERGVALHQPDFAPMEAARYGQDLGVGGLSYLAWTVALIGELDHAAELAARGLRLARERGHAFSLALALHWTGLVGCERHEPAPVEAHAQELLALSWEQRFEFFAALALSLLGWARFAQGDAATGIARMREGADRFRATHQRVGNRLRAHLAEALAVDGALDEALAMVDDALAHCRASGEGGFLSELHRIKGEALWRRRPGDGEAARWLEEAIAIASAQGATTLALRAATRLVRLQREHGVPRPAVETLRDVYARLTEGRDLRDAKEARALIDD